MAKNKLLRYKNYCGSYEMCFDTNTLSGKIEFINALVTFEAETPAQLEEEFHLAVDDYLQTCEELGYTPEKSMSGTFNVRIGEETHRAAAIYAMDNNISMNKLVGEALKAYVSDEQTVIHNHQHEHEHTHRVLTDAVPLEGFGIQQDTLKGRMEWAVNESAKNTH